MSLLDADFVRSKTFTRALRGYHNQAVSAYLGRVALLLDVMGHDSSPLPELPADFGPEAIRSHKFDVLWRGYDRGEVDDFLGQLGDAIAAEVKWRDELPVHVPEQVDVGRLSAQISELVDRAAAGERITVTRDGEPVAELGPPTDR